MKEDDKITTRENTILRKNRNTPSTEAPPTCVFFPDPISLPHPHLHPHPPEVTSLQSIMLLLFKTF